MHKVLFIFYKLIAIKILIKFFLIRQTIKIEKKTYDCVYFRTEKVPANQPPDAIYNFLESRVSALVRMIINEMVTCTSSPIRYDTDITLKTERFMPNLFFWNKNNNTSLLYFYSSLRSIY